MRVPGLGLGPLRGDISRARVLGEGWWGCEHPSRKVALPLPTRPTRHDPKLCWSQIKRGHFFPKALTQGFGNTPFQQGRTSFMIDRSWKYLQLSNTKLSPYQGIDNWHDIFYPALCPNRTQIVSHTNHNVKPTMVPFFFK